MKMRSSNYWRRREEEALQHYITEEEDYDRQIQQIYKTMLANIQTEIDAFYGRYASKEGITLQEAKKRVSQADIEAYARKAKEYVARKDLSDIANEEMRLYNLKMKVNRLEMLKARIGMEVTAGTDEMDKHMGAVLKKRVYDELKRQAGILGYTVVNNEELAHVIPNASFHGATFSERLWRQDKQMMEDLSRLLQSGLIRGKNPRVLAQEIRRYFVGDTRLKNSGGVIFNAERLMRTELARVQTAAQKASFEANGFTQYEYIANSRCCDACQALDGKHFDVADMMPGENAAPLHPNCRCSVAAYDDGEEYQRWLKEVEAEGDEGTWAERRSGFNPHAPISVNIDDMQRVNSTFMKVKTSFGDVYVQESMTKDSNFDRHLLKERIEEVAKFIQEEISGDKKYYNHPPKLVFSEDGQVTRNVKAVGAYNAVQNTLTLGRSTLAGLHDELVNPERQAENERYLRRGQLPPRSSKATIIHEIQHFKTARRMFGNKNPTKKQYDKYLRQDNEKAKKYIDELTKMKYSVHEVSNYSNIMLQNRDFIEVRTELETYLKMGGVLDDLAGKM